MTFEEFIRKGIVSGATQFTFEPAPAYDKCVQVFDMDNVLKDKV